MSRRGSFERSQSHQKQTAVLDLHKNHPYKSGICAIAAQIPFRLWLEFPQRSAITSKVFTSKMLCIKQGAKALKTQGKHHCVQLQGSSDSSGVFNQLSNQKRLGKLPFLRNK